MKIYVSFDSADSADLAMKAVGDSGIKISHRYMGTTSGIQDEEPNRWYVPLYPENVMGAGRFSVAGLAEQPVSGVAIYGNREPDVPEETWVEAEIPDKDAEKFRNIVISKGGHRLRMWK